MTNRCKVILAEETNYEAGEITVVARLDHEMRSRYKCKNRHKLNSSSSYVLTFCHTRPDQDDIVRLDPEHTTN